MPARRRPRRTGSCSSTSTASRRGTSWPATTASWRSTRTRWPAGRCATWSDWNRDLGTTTATTAPRSRRRRPPPPQPVPARPPAARPPSTTLDDRHHLFWSLAFGVTAATWDDLGGFDTGYSGYGAEDTDFAMRARRHGVEMAWFAGGTAFHQWHPPTRHDPARLAGDRRQRPPLPRAAGAGGRWTAGCASSTPPGSSTSTPTTTCSSSPTT